MPSTWAFGGHAVGTCFTFGPNSRQVINSRYADLKLFGQIALAVIKNGKKLKGQKLLVPMKDKTIKVTVSDYIFFDSKNERLNA